MAEISMFKTDDKKLKEYHVTHGVDYLRVVFVNVFFVSASANGNKNTNGERDWVLIDAGLKGSAGKIIKRAEKLYGQGTKPKAIILTHGHFDHIGALEKLLIHWDVPVYAHPLEMPYLRGMSHYPPPDPTVGGGMMAMMSPLYPDSPINLGNKVQPLPQNNTVPFLPGWRWIHTPGHSPGHISLLRTDDCMLIAGDAFVTTKQESVFSVMTQHREIHGPPAYFTPDWQAAKHSVHYLARLRPPIVATGHGRPMYGAGMLMQLIRMSRYFDELAVPLHGRYVDSPAVTNENGVVYLPPPVPNPTKKILAVAGLAALAGLAIAMAIRKSRD